MNDQIGAVSQACHGSIIGGAAIHKDKTTIGDAIDKGIAHHRKQIALLEEIRFQIEVGSMLNISLDDLSILMRF